MSEVKKALVTKVAATRALQKLRDEDRKHMKDMAMEITLDRIRQAERKV